MTTAADATSSTWMETAEIPRFPRLTADLTTDVCVVGGGIAGVTTAYLLACEGARVALVEAGDVGSGETARTTAHLSNALDHLYCDVEDSIGVAGARSAAHSHSFAIDLIERLVDRERIACDFERLDGYLFEPPGGSGSDLRRELEAAHRAGLGGVSLLSRAPLPRFDTGPCLRFPRQAQFHPLKYLAGLVRAFAIRGGRIYCHSRVNRVEGGSPVVVTTADGCRVTARQAVIATNSPIHEYPLIHLKQSPYRTYVIGADLPCRSVTRALYWDTADPFHYVRLCRGRNASGDLLLVGGEDHRAGEEDDGTDRFDALEDWACRRFPIRSIVHRWSGQVMESSDGVGLIGRDRLDQPNVFYATGDSGQGMTHGTIAGVLITDLLCRRDNAWSSLYDPGRLPVTWDFLQENLEVLWHYAEWVTGGDVGGVDAVARGEGAIVRRGLVKVAVSRDRDGTVSEMSAVCPHLGCIVSWNSSEERWNCPCHGSQFDCRGRVLAGPATADMRPLDR
jgi:glycine/D-amino acid oxidase-like deaminating enzyme/nitrite reductase/ring-hydroxylating ferredoxin subunit